MKSLHAMLVASFVSASLYACGGPPQKPVVPEQETVETDAGADEPPPPPATTFEKVGKREGLQAIVELFLKNATVDPGAKNLFKNWKGDRVQELQAVLVDHLCKGTGGECTPAEPSGKAMTINDKQFEALQADFKAAMDEQKVDEENQTELAKAFDGLREPLGIILNTKK